MKTWAAGTFSHDVLLRLTSGWHPKEVVPFGKSVSCQNLIFSCVGLFSFGSMNWCSSLGILQFLHARREGRNLQWGREELRTSPYLLDSYLSLNQSKLSVKVHPWIKYQLFNSNEKQCWRELEGPLTSARLYFNLWKLVSCIILWLYPLKQRGNVLVLVSINLLFSYLQLFQIHGRLRTEMYPLLKYFDDQETTVIAGKKRKLLI